ncbi:MAG TPA: glycoside hydrolase family 19 protein [Pyrinomonadaceae bacterium]|nr:glycoside hydrolase family 19 protein [Pyrinomonadaceae bacterium]
MVTDDELRQLMPNLPAPRRAELLGPLQQAMNEFGITNRLREAAFLATLAVESGELRLMVENLNYSAQRLLQVFPKYFKTAALANEYGRQPEKIANRVYADRMGNGPESGGDGWRYRGRGVIQITGRNNYRTHGQAIGVDIEQNPDLAADPAIAFRIAGAFWKSNGCNPLADEGRFDKISKIINGRFPPHGWPERQRYYARAKQVLSSGDAAPASPVPAGAAPPMAGAAKKSAAKRAGAPPPPAAEGGRTIPAGLSRGIYPGREQEPTGAAAKKAAKGGAKSATKAATKSAAKSASKSAAKASKKSAAKASKKSAAKSAKKSGAKSAKKGATKGGAKKSGAKKGAGKKNSAKKGVVARVISVVKGFK